MSEIKFLFREKENAVDFASGSKYRKGGREGGREGGDESTFGPLMSTVLNGAVTHSPSLPPSLPPSLLLALLDDARIPARTNSGGPLLPLLTTTSHSLPPSLPPSPSSSVSSMMHEYPPEQILWGPYSLSWDEQVVKDYLALLTPERMHLTVVSKVGREGGREGGKGMMLCGALTPSPRTSRW